MAVSWERLVEYAGGLDPDPEFAGLDDVELDAQLAVQASAVAAATARWIVLVAELVVRGAWTESGARTPGDWLSYRVSMAPNTARDHIRVGLCLRTLPKVRARFLDGTLSYSKVRAITRVADGKSEDLLLSYADACPANELERIVAKARWACTVQGVEAGLFADNAADGTDAGARVERFDMHQLDDGSFEVKLRMDEVDGARLGEQVAWLARSQDEDLPLDARRVAAVLEAIGAAMDTVPADGSGQDRDRLLVEATVIDARSAGDSAESPPRLRLVPRVGSGRSRAMSVRALQRLACTAAAVTVTHDEDGHALDVGRAQRHATAAQRRALALRDGSCRFPGCTASRHLQAHHAIEWHDDGPTDLDNLLLLCGFHHRFLHNAGWKAVPHGGGRFQFLDTHDRQVPMHDSAESPPLGPSGLPIIHAIDTVDDEQALQPRWWDGQRIDWDLAVAVLADSYRRRLRGVAGQPLPDPLPKAA